MVHERASALQYFGELVVPGREREEQKCNPHGLGSMYRGDMLSQAFVCSQLKRLDENNALRVRNCHFLTEHLSPIVGIETPSVPDHCDHVFYNYVVGFRPDELGLDVSPRTFRENVQKAPAAEGVPVGQWQRKSMPARGRRHATRAHKAMLRAMVTCTIGLCVLGVGHRSLAAGITWEEAQEMLRSGEGLSKDPTHGALVENPTHYGAEANPTGDPIGGGAGYRDILTSGDYTVGTRQELLDALEQAKEGQVVYVKPGAEIDLTDLTRIAVPDGVTLAGDRGAGGGEGPLVFTRDFGTGGYRGLLHAGSKSRVTGLRLRGPDPDYADYTEQTKAAAYDASARGILAGAASEVDNCEISNFYRDGIAVNVADVRIHHNYLHDIAAYPVIVGTRPGSSAIIEANIIHWGWHATAGTGAAGTSYEACYNICRPHRIAPAFGPTVSHCLDQHADRDIKGARGQSIAGDWLRWHHNTIELKGPYTTYDRERIYSSPNNACGMKIRGTPRVLAEVYNNWIQTSNIAQALGPYGGPGEQAYGNVWVYNNAYGPEKRKLAEIPYRTTPQILFKSPGPPEVDSHQVRGKLALDVEVNVLEPLRLAGVIVTLDDEELFLEPRAPRAGEVVIDAAVLGEGDHKLSVSAIDNRGALGTQYVYVTPGK